MSYFKKLTFKQEDFVDTQVKQSVNSEKNLSSTNQNTKNKSIIQIDMPEQKDILENYFLCTQEINNQLMNSGENQIINEYNILSKTVNQNVNF